MTNSTKLAAIIECGTIHTYSLEQVKAQIISNHATGEHLYSVDEEINEATNYFNKGLYLCRFEANENRTDLDFTAVQQFTTLGNFIKMVYSNVCCNVVTEQNRTAVEQTR